MTDESTKPSHRRSLRIMLLFVCFMFGFGYALVPMYNVFCKKLGINGKITGPSLDDAALHVDNSRDITLEFVTTHSGNMQWKFYPEQKSLTFHPGQMQRAMFYAENDSDHTMTVQAIASVTPGEAAKYLKKTECFCFTQQTLAAHEKIHMPILFHFDVDLPKRFNTITLSYTLFDVSSRFQGRASDAQFFADKYQRFQQSKSQSTLTGEPHVKAR